MDGPGRQPLSARMTRMMYCDQWSCRSQAVMGNVGTEVQVWERCWRDVSRGRCRGRCKGEVAVLQESKARAVGHSIDLISIVRFIRLLAKASSCTSLLRLLASYQWLFCEHQLERPGCSHDYRIKEWYASSQSSVLLCYPT
jgi:hypothetical protein